MFNISHQNRRQDSPKSLLDIPYDVRLEIYNCCLSNGFNIHCNTIKNKDHLYCLQAANLDIAPRGPRESEIWKTLGVEARFENDTKRRDDCVDAIKLLVKEESVLSSLLRTCRAVNKEVSQHCLFLLSRRDDFLRPASCINSALWWMYGKLRLVDLDLVSVPESTRQAAQVEVDVARWRIELMRDLAQRFVDIRGAYGQGNEVVSQRVQLCESTRHWYGARRRPDHESMRSSRQSFGIEISAFARLGQWFGMADLVKCVVAVEIVLQALRLGNASNFLGAGTRHMCRVYDRSGIGNEEKLVVFEAEGWKIVGWKEKASEERID